MRAGRIDGCSLSFLFFPGSFQLASFLLALSGGQKRAVFVIFPTVYFESKLPSAGQSPDLGVLEPDSHKMRKLNGKGWIKSLGWIVAFAGRCVGGPNPESANFDLYMLKMSITQGRCIDSILYNFGRGIDKYMEKRCTLQLIWFWDFGSVWENLFFLIFQCVFKLLQDWSTSLWKHTLMLPRTTYYSLWTLAFDWIRMKKMP